MYKTKLTLKPSIIFYLFFLLSSAFPAVSEIDTTFHLKIPQNVWIDYSERILVVNWDSVSGSIGYNIYRSSKIDAKKEEMEKINQKLITSAPRFVLIWRFDNGIRERTIKGYRHFVWVTSVFINNGDTTESALSTEVSNEYFNGYTNMTTKKKIKKVFIDKQESDYLPVNNTSNSKNKFIKFMTGPGIFLTKVLRDSLNFQEIGACDPISTVALNLLSKWGLYALKAEGMFIEEYHNFLVINIENVEYILDFSADQFIPDVAPVIIPRDLCFINKKGNLDKTGKPIYQIANIILPESTKLNNSKESQVYHHIYDKVYNKYFK